MRGVMAHLVMVEIKVHTYSILILDYNPIPIHTKLNRFKIKFSQLRNKKLSILKKKLLQFNSYLEDGV